MEYVTVLWGGLAPRDNARRSHFTLSQPRQVWQEGEPHSLFYPLPRHQTVEDLCQNAQTLLRWRTRILCAGEYILLGQPDLLHSLLEDRVSSGLTNDQVCPLHNHNADKEGSMASELHYFPLFVGLETKAESIGSNMLPLLSGTYTKFSRH